MPRAQRGDQAGRREGPGAAGPSANYSSRAPDLNRAIIEKFEAHADVGFAVVLMTSPSKRAPQIWFKKEVFEDEKVDARSGDFEQRN